MSESVARHEPALYNLTALAEQVTGGPGWLAERRRTALEHFRECGFPDSRLEAWKQTSVAPIARSSFVRGDSTGAAEAFAEFPLSGLDTPRLVLVNGRLDAELSRVDGLPAGVRFQSLAVALEERDAELQSRLGSTEEATPHALAALNTASFDDGAWLHVRAGAQIELPLHIVHLTVGDRPVVSHPRTVIAIEPGARAVVIESFWGPDGVGYFTNAVGEIHVAENAELNHTRVQWEGREAYHVGVLHGSADRSARYVNTNVSLGSALARQDLTGVLAGEGAEVTLDGLYLAVGTQHIDNHTWLDHAQPHCPSHELYKGILSDRARAVFNGRILVRQDAQKTDAKQSNKNMLLSDDAMVHTRPQLEIYADDVRCTHGATIGHLQEDALFYLQARGIGRHAAHALLIQAFAGEVLQRIPYEPLRQRLERHVIATVARELEGTGGE